ncbi:rhomboid family intramembrane serine protease [Prevotella aurantiaca]|jgi:peptidase, S54 family|uniref:Rhomboid family intramembrane serine protease n=1 Tax=Prevotella aurantiaca TaxID=596085 RepID=A0A930HM97_9BACT|nr:rhomboid family intramembrane serine protease [Prevotella aurantiaca]MBF1384407.1 rhomboid family intramembrane serine protease [Prevotella aurantiaca]MBF1385737.1 rhomboid family intramembrane serine protease [Prevotella aurantiaca]
MRNIPTVTKNLLILNVLAYIASIILAQSGIDLNNILGLHFFLADNFHLWQIVTYMFMHGSFMHILMNMFMLWMFGMVMESVWGPKKFLLFYMVTGIGAGLCQELAQYANYVAEGLSNYQYVSTEMGRITMDSYLNLWTTVGASGAVYGVLLAFGLTFPNERMFIIPIPIPLKAKWIIMGSIAMELFSAMGTSNDGVAHLAHLGGMLFGYLLIRYWRKHPFSDNDFGMNRGRQFFDNMRDNWESRTNRSTGNNQGDSNNGFQWNTNHTQQTQQPESDWDYNARKKKEQEEVDRILDKIRKSGYDSLSKEEKKKLFDSSKS